MLRVIKFVHVLEGFGQVAPAVNALSARVLLALPGLLLLPPPPLQLAQVLVLPQLLRTCFVKCDVLLFQVCFVLFVCCFL